MTNVVYHLCGPGVIKDSRYQAFMRGFNSNVNVRRFLLIFLAVSPEPPPL